MTEPTRRQFLRRASCLVASTALLHSIQGDMQNAFAIEPLPRSGPTARPFVYLGIIKRPPHLSVTAVPSVAYQSNNSIQNGFFFL